MTHSVFVVQRLLNNRVLPFRHLLRRAVIICQKNILLFYFKKWISSRTKLRVTLHSLSGTLFCLALLLLEAHSMCSRIVLNRDGDVYLDVFLH